MLPCGTNTLTLVAFIFINLLQDWWGLAVLLILVLATPNTILVQRRFVKGWKGKSEPGMKGNLLIFIDPHRWVRLKGPVDALEAVTAG